MKRSTTITTVLLALFAVFAITASAVEPVAGAGVNIESPAFIDENCDGVCDNYQAGVTGLGRGQGGGVQANFIDSDDDGVCDNNTAGGRGLGKGLGKGVRANFVDADVDGVCDNVGSGISTANRGGRGNGRALKK